MHEEKKETSESDKVDKPVEIKEKYNPENEVINNKSSKQSSLEVEHHTADVAPVAASIYNSFKEEPEDSKTYYIS